MSNESLSVALDRLAQTLREAAMQADRVTWSLDHGGASYGHAWPLESQGELVAMAEQALPAQVEAVQIAEKEVEEKFVPSTTYPKLVGGTTINWDALRMVASSRLSKLIADKVYTPRVASDRGYMWIAEQLGQSGSVRDFLVNPTTKLTAENFIRMCQWLGYDPAEFVDYEEKV